MPFTTLVAGTVITASWANSNVRDQVVTPFASAATRAAAIPAPITGMLTHRADGPTFEGYDGTNWAQPASLRVGAIVPRTADVSVTTPETIADSLTVTLLAGRRYEIVWTGVTYSTSAGDSYAVRLRYAAGAAVTSAGTMIVERSLVCPTNNGATPTTIVWEINGIAAGQTTFGCFLVRTFGGGTIRSSASADNKTAFYIKDIGV